MKSAPLILALASTLSVAFAGDETCTRLAAFESAPLTQKDKSVSHREWIEFRWTGVWLGEDGWGWQCTHSDSTAATALCGWLGHNTSIEFHQFLPERILACHGTHFSKSMRSKEPWIQIISVEPASRSRHMLLEIALGAHKGDDVIRYSVLPNTASERDYPLPPLFPPEDFTGL